MTENHLKKGKSSHTRYQTLGQELIPVYRQSACGLTACRTRSAPGPRPLYFAALSCGYYLLLFLPFLLTLSSRRLDVYYTSTRGQPAGMVSLQVTVSHPPGCHYFPPVLQLPSQPQSITTFWPLPSYTAWWQRRIGVNNLPKVVTQHCPK